MDPALKFPSQKIIAGFLAIIASLALDVGLAQAQSSRVYFAGYLGLNTFTESEFSESTTLEKGDIELDNAFSLAGAIGLRLTPQWRIEAEVSRRSAHLDRIDYSGGTSKIGGDVTTWLYMFNLYYDINWDWKNFQPFLTAGLGFADHEAQITDTAGIVPVATNDSEGFAYSVGGGLKYRVNPEVAITSNYRYIGTNDLEVDSYDLEYTTHEWRMGLEYDLPVGWITESSWAN